MTNSERLNFYLDFVEKSLNDFKKYKNKISPFLPITHKNYQELNENFSDTLDAIAFRFNKIQSLLGEKVFKLFLNELGYLVEDKSFLEILNELEKLDIIDRKTWIALREIRNKISHEYPEEIEEIIENLEKMIESFLVFERIYFKIKEKLEIK